jgi:WD40 repeat protein
LIDRVNALGFSPDGQLLATGSGEPSRSGELKIWKVSTGELVREIKNAHSDVVLGIDFSADGKLLVSGAADKFVRVFELGDGKLVKSFEGHTHHVLGVSWKRDGRTLASCGADKVIKVWDVVTGEQRKTIDGVTKDLKFTKEVTSIHYVDGSNEFLVASGDNQVARLREDGENVRTFAGAADFIQSVGITPDGKVVLGGSQDGVLRVWNGTNGEVIHSFGPPKTDSSNKLAATSKAAN